MKKRMSIDKKSKIAFAKMMIFAVVLGFVGQYLLKFGFAATGPTLFVAPSSANVVKDTTINIAVRLDTAGQAVDGVEAFLTYPDNLLEFVSISEANSSFGIGLPSNGGGGNIAIRRVVNPDSSPTVSGANLLVATVTLKARTDTGTAAVNFTPQSRVTAPSAGNGSVLANTIGGSYTMSGSSTSPAVTTSPSSPTSSPTTTSQPAKTGAAVATTQQQPASQPASTTTQNTTPAQSPQPDSTTPTIQALPNVVLEESNQSAANAQPRRNSLVLLIAKLAGGALLLGSLALVAKMLISIRRNHLVPAMGGNATSAYSFDNDLRASNPVNMENPNPARPGTTFDPKDRTDSDGS